MMNSAFNTQSNLELLRHRHGLVYNNIIVDLILDNNQCKILIKIYFEFSEISGKRSHIYIYIYMGYSIICNPKYMQRKIYATVTICTELIYTNLYIFK